MKNCSDEPEQQQPLGRDVAEEDEEPRMSSDADAHVGEQHEVGAHDAGDGARCADHGHRAVGVEGHERGRGRQRRPPGRRAGSRTAPARSSMLLPKIQRKSMLPADVQHAAVQEHRVQHGQVHVLVGKSAGSSGGPGRRWCRAGSIRRWRAARRRSTAGCARARTGWPRGRRLKIRSLLGSFCCTKSCWPLGCTKK